MSAITTTLQEGLNDLPFAGPAISDLERLVDREPSQLRALRTFLDWLSSPPLDARLQRIMDEEAFGNDRVTIIMPDDPAFPRLPFTFCVDVQDLRVRVMVRKQPEPTPVILRIEELVPA
jgi:hypothetical protein